MKKFSFSFQYLLDAHRAKEQAAEYKLVLATRAQEDIERMIFKLQQTRILQVDSLAKMTGRIQRTDYTARLRHIDSLSRRQESLEKESQKAAEKVEACRAELRREMTSRKVHEKLCERERTEWVDEVMAEEQKNMDELAAARWSRQGRAV